MTFSIRRAAVLTFACVFGISNMTQAAPVTFLFGGQVTGSQISSAANIGDSFSGSFTFESTTPDSNSDPLIGRFDNTISELLVNAGSYSGFATDGDISINNDFGPSPFDRYTVRSDNPFDGLSPSVSGFAPVSFVLQSFDPTASAFSSDVLPITPPNLAAFTSTFFTLRFFNASQSVFASITGTIDSLAEAGVPAPAASAILIIGLAALGLRRRKA